MTAALETAALAIVMIVFLGFAAVTVILGSLAVTP